MKKITILVLLLSFLTLVACKSNKGNEKLPKGVHKVVVTQRIDASEYSYLKVDENGENYWIAVPQMNVKKGDVLYYSKSITMTNFRSKTLDRVFKSVLFVEDISKTSDINEHQNIYNKEKTSTAPTNIKVKPLKDGYTVAQINKDRKKLEGKIVKVRGEVVKFNDNIMGRNWVHIQDGTGKTGTNDLLLTTKDKANVGDVIVAEGKVVVDKDFGSGYFYKVLLENTKIKK